jgi:ATP-dependent Clp protease ATP-binding subunit ClpC
MGRSIVPKLKKIITNSTIEASGFDDNKVRPQHIILSMINEGNNKCVDILSAMNVDLNELYDVISDYARNIDFTPKTSSITHKFKLPKDYSDETKKILNSVDRESEKLNDKSIDTTHVMLSILSNKNQLTNLLFQHGVNYKDFKKTLLDMKTDIKSSIDEDGDDTYDMGEDDLSRHSKKKSKSDPKSKTPVLDNFCRDVTKMVEQGKIDPIVGREVEIKRVSQILARRKKNNPVLIGEAGVGKTSIVEGLAQLIVDGKAPRIILDKKIYSLDLASIVAGTKYRGQFEERMKAILDELKSNPDVVLFIDELHTLVGAGNASGSLDASNIFKPALARGELQVIGATTLDEYRENIEKDKALTRRFQEVLINEPSLNDTKTILENIKEKYEDHHKVKYTDEAIEECVKLADRYITDRSMPDKAIDILDEAGATTNVNVETPKHIKVLELEKENIKEEKLMVVNQQKYEEAAQLRDKEKEINQKLEQAKNDWLAKMDEKRTVVDSDIVADVVSSMTGIPISKISTQETKKLRNMDKELTGRVIGQDDAVERVVKAIKRNRIGIKRKNKPIGSFIFLGPTGVGKTYLAKLLAEQMFGDSDALVRIDMSEYMEKFTVSRLIGPPPGYVGYEEGGQLTEVVRRKPYSVVLLDEIEKAHDDIFNLLLQLLDEGHLTDGLGRKINFKNTLIIMTSNIGVKEVSQFGKGMGFSTKAKVANEEGHVQSIIEKALKGKFKPEFLNRIDDTIIFKSLKLEDIHKIIHNEIGELESRINEMGYQVKISKPAIEFLANQGYDEEFGARPLARTIQNYVEDKIADEVLNDNVKEGDIIKIGFNKSSEEITITIERPKLKK